MKSLKNTQTKSLPSNVSEWKWGSFEKIIIYTFSGILFSLSMIIDIITRDSKEIKIKDLYIIGLSFIGFIALFIFQIVNRWIYGLIVIGLTLLINLYSLFDLLKKLNII